MNRTWHPVRYLATCCAAFFMVLAGNALARTGENDPLAQDYEPAPALWQLSDEDTTIYLFGTIHLLPPGFRWRNPQFDAIVEEAETLVLESNEEDARESMAAMAPKMQAVREGRRATSLQLAPSVRSKWRKLVEATGAPFETIDNTPLPMAILGFGFDAAQSGPSQYEYGVEAVLEGEFRSSGKPIESIENHGAVLLSLMRIDERAIVKELEADLARWPGKNIANFTGQQGLVAQPEEWSLEHEWASGIVQDEFDLGLGDGKLGAAFNRVLLERRNIAWAYWLDRRLEEPGTILVAVGAGHFEGSDSVLVQLQARGLTAVRIN